MDAEVTGLDGCVVQVVHPERVAAARRGLLSTQEMQGVSEMFRVLGDPGCARIVSALVEAGELCVCDLSEALALPPTAVGSLLRRLRGAGIVRSREDGRMVHYSVTDAHVRLLIDLSAEHLRHPRS